MVPGAPYMFVLDAFRYRYQDIGEQEWSNNSKRRAAAVAIHGLDGREPDGREPHRTRDESLSIVPPSILFCEGGAV